MKKELPKGLRTIIGVNSIAVVITTAFWVLIILKVFLGHGVTNPINVFSRASIFGFLVSDVLVALPLLIMSVPGLIKLKSWGWSIAQMANAIWVYSIVCLWSRDVYVGTPTPGDIVFLPLALFSLWSMYYLWLKRRLFWVEFTKMQ